MVGENFNKPIRKMKAKANKDKMLRAQKSKTKQTGDIIHGKAFNRSKLKKEKKIKKGPAKLAKLADKMDVDEPNKKPKSKAAAKPKKDEDAMEID